VDGISLDPHSYPGSAFWTAQQTFLGLQREGVLLCLASKNEPADVLAVLDRHPAQVIRTEHVVTQQVSWQDKASSLRAIARDLNIGLDSLVFVDDSPFEVEAVRAQLPQVTTFLVPQQPWEYPALANRIAELFLAGRPGGTHDDKTEQYRIRALAEADRADHGTEQDYLRSLQIEVELRVDDRSRASRIAELTQKSNQFNLTTRRYGDGEILAVMDDPNAAVVALHVRDRFGDHGLTGVLIASFRDSAVEIDAFLMSCRVIGRGIERSCWSTVAALGAARGCTELRATFLPTPKNPQVARFFDDLGLDRTEDTPMAVRYAAALSQIDQHAPDHLTIHVD
jgi:FkbH-like protein